MKARSVSAQREEQSEAIALRDKIVLENLPLVKAIALRVHDNLPVHVDLDDLIHAGVMGLFDAAVKYDAHKEVAFRSYAKHRIKGAILDSLRQLDWASRDLRKRHKQLEVVTRELTTLASGAPEESQIAEKMGVGLQRWRQMAVELRMVGLLSASSRQPESENQTIPEFPAKPESQPDNIWERKQMGCALGTAMQKLPARYQRVVALYYAKEMTMKEIGALLGINESRVSQIHKSALEKMGAALQEQGIHSSEALV